MASLVQRKNGWYYLQFFDRLRRPKRKRIPLRTKTRRTAETLKRKYEDLYALGDFDPWDTRCQDRQEEIITLRDARNAFLKSKSHCSNKTVSNYRSVLDLLVEYLGADFSIRFLKGSYLGDWLEASKIKPISKATYLRQTRTFCRFLVRRKVLKRDPTRSVTLETPPAKHPRYLSPADLRRLLDAVEPPYGWLKPLVEVNCYLGLRRGEICHLRWSAVDLERRRLAITCSKEFSPKTRRSGRSRYAGQLRRFSPTYTRARR